MTLEPSSFETLLVDEHADRIVATLHRPEVRNAIDARMAAELDRVCAAVEDDPRILILAGSEGVFASGADIAQLRERRRDDALRGVNSRVFSRIARLPMPVIAVVDGYALGGGAELALAADFRLGSPRTRFGNPEVGLGILAAAGASWRLREVVGESVAKQMLLAGRRLDADEALAAGLLDAVHPGAELMAAAHELADRIAVQDPLAVRISKLVFHAPRAAHPAIDDLAQAVLFESPAKAERMQAFLDRPARPSRTKETDG